MEFILNLSHQQANEIVAAAREIIKANPTSDVAQAMHALIVGIQAPPASYWTRGVQVSLSTTTGERVTDTALAHQILADLFTPGDVYTEDIDNEGDGIFLVSIPAELYRDVSDEGTAVLTHSGGWVLEVPAA